MLLLPPVVVETEARLMVELVLVDAAPLVLAPPADVPEVGGIIAVAVALPPCLP
jgi:hypothetical protein